MTDFFTADLHFMHVKIAEYCPGRYVLGATPEQQALGLIDRWNSVVRPQDRVFLLGDGCMGKIAESVCLLAKLNGTIEWWCGNHDRPWIGHPEKKRAGWRAAYEAAKPGYITVHEEHYGAYQGVEFNHFPFTGDSHGEDRYKEHRPTDKGQWLLHGHVHDAWKINGRQINVGVDVHEFFPVPFEALDEIMRRG